MELRWADVGYATQPASFPFHDGKVEVKRQHVATWQESPNAVLTVVSASIVLCGVRRYAIGGYYIPDDDDPAISSAEEASLSHQLAELPG